jgi:hypothetical protein
MGDKLYADKGQVFEPGGFVSMPAGMNHFAWATTETIVQVHGNGPFAIVYVNPADDPKQGALTVHAEGGMRCLLAATVQVSPSWLARVICNDAVSPRDAAERAGDAQADISRD